MSGHLPRKKTDVFQAVQDADLFEDLSHIATLFRSYRLASNLTASSV